MPVVAEVVDPHRRVPSGRERLDVGDRVGVADGPDRVAGTPLHRVDDRLRAGVVHGGHEVAARHQTAGLGDVAVGVGQHHLRRDRVVAGGQRTPGAESGTQGGDRRHRVVATRHRAHPARPTGPAGRGALATAR